MPIDPLVSPRSPALSVWASFKLAFFVRPLSVAVPTMMIPIGIAALVLGEGVSRAFTLIDGGSLIAHVMGMLLALGGFITMVGIVRLGTLVELLGLVLVAAGSFIYATGVLLGLGLNGVVAAGAYMAIAIGCVGRVILLSKMAQTLNGDH